MSLSSLIRLDKSVFEFESRNKNVDGETDVGHINLIGGLVTRNPPNKIIDTAGFYKVRKMKQVTFV